MVKRVKVNKNNRISLPPDARKELGVEPGDHLFVTVIDGGMFVTREPEILQEYMNQGRDAGEDRTK